MRRITLASRQPGISDWTWLSGVIRAWLRWTLLRVLPMLLMLPPSRCCAWMVVANDHSQIGRPRCHWYKREYPAPEGCGQPLERFGPHKHCGDFILKSAGLQHKLLIWGDDHQIRVCPGKK